MHHKKKQALQTTMAVHEREGEEREREFTLFFFTKTLPQYSSFSLLCRICTQLGETHKLIYKNQIIGKRGRCTIKKRVNSP